MYLMVGTRPNLAFSVVGMLRYISKPIVSHWEAVKEVLLYIAGTAAKCLVFSGESVRGLLQGYCDLDDAEVGFWNKRNIFPRECCELRFQVGQALRAVQH